MTDETEPTEGQKRSPMRQISWETQELVKQFRALGAGGILTYEDACKAVSFDKETQMAKLYPRARTARKILERDRIAILVVQGVGFKRATDPETVRVLEDGCRRANRAIKGAISLGTCLQKPDELSKADTELFNSRLSVLAASERVTSRKTMRAVEKEVRLVAGQLPSERVLELWSGKK